MTRAAAAEALPHLLAVSAAQARSGQPAPLFEALERATAACLGHRLFTIMRHHAAERESERIYSSAPTVYPVGGRKPVRATPSTEAVFGRRKPYIGRTAADIRACFGDHQLIFSLGCESVLNLPVVFDGRVLGTLNLLHEAGWYDAGDVPLGLLFAALAVPGCAEGRAPGERPG